MSAPHIQETIARLFEKGLGAQEQARAMAHIRDCEDCKKLFERYAEAERALYVGATSEGQAPPSFDRVQARLLESAPAPRPRLLFKIAPLIAIAAAVVLFIQVIPSDEFRSRGRNSPGQAPALDAAFAVRALRLRMNNDGQPQVQDAASATLVPRDKLKVLLSTGASPSWVRFVILSEDREVLYQADVQSVTENTIEARMEGLVSVMPSWKPGRLTLVAIFSEHRENAEWMKNTYLPSDAEGVWVRTMSTRLEPKP